MLPGWHNSDGALMEYLLANHLGIKMYRLFDFIREEIIRNKIIREEEDNNAEQN